MEYNAFEKIQEIKDKVCYKKYNFYGREIYHSLILNTIQDMIAEKANLKFNGFTDSILDNDDEQKFLIMNVLTDMIDIIGTLDDNFVEKVLSLICQKFDNQDYSYNPEEFISPLNQVHNSSCNNMPVISNQNILHPVNHPIAYPFNFQDYNADKISSSLVKSNTKAINNFDILHNQNLQLMYQKQYYHQAITNDIDRKVYAHNLTMMQLRLKGFDIFKDQNNKLFYTRKLFGEKQKTTISELRDVCHEILGYHMSVYNNSDEVLVIDASYLIVSLLKTVRKEIFNPFSNLEFIFIGNNLWDRNTFEYTKYLNKRFEPKTFTYEKTFLETFLNEIFPIQEQSQFMMTWYSKYMRDGVKSDIVIILIGDSETTDILVNSIYKPIFTKRKKYISVIDDDFLSKESNDENLLNNKVLYHIDNLGAKADKRRVKKLVRTIARPNFISPVESWNTDESYIYGNLLITSSKDSPFPYVEDIFSQCVVFRVRDIKTIQKKLNLDRSQLDQLIKNDLDNFSTKLLQQDNNHLTVINTDEKSYLESMKNGVLITPEIDCKIDNYVSNVIGKNIEAFEAIKIYDETMYDEFLTNINEDMIAQPLQSTYFNIINGEELIPHNGEFLEMLKNKADMFKGTPTDKSKTNGKKRYNIF